ncbi:MAG: prepilin-type N-terminal cleavage/methylation domain-containing protein [Pseudomonadota bacterium]
MMGRRKDKKTQAGFTLIELMVAVFVGAIVIYGVYSIFSSSQRIFHEEQRISQAQLAARLGMEVVKNDIKRMGYMMSPNIDRDPLVCNNAGGPALVRIHPVEHINGTAGQVFTAAGGTAPIIEPAANWGIAPDAVYLAGNYTSSVGYLAQTILTGTGQVQLQDIGRRRLPGEAPATYVPVLPTQQEFERMFPDDGYLRVVNKFGYMMFAEINGIPNLATRTIRVTGGNLPDASLGNVACGIHGYGEGSEVNVVNRVLYRIEVDQSPGAPAGKTDLVRWQVDENDVPVPNSREIIVEFAVDFQVWFRMNTPVGGVGSEPQVEFMMDVPADNVVVIPGTGGGVPPVLDGTLNAQPERLRVAIIRISVRSDVEDPTFPFIARTNANDPLWRFELSAAATGSAHVRTLISQVELTNIAFRNL